MEKLKELYDNNVIDTEHYYEVLLEKTNADIIANSTIANNTVFSNSTVALEDIYNFLNYFEQSYDVQFFENKEFTIIGITDDNLLNNILNIHHKYVFEKLDNTKPSIIII
jgi:hypothetical protein